MQPLPKKNTTPFKKENWKKKKNENSCNNSKKKSRNLLNPKPAYLPTYLHVTVVTVVTIVKLVKVVTVVDFSWTGVMIDQAAAWSFRHLPDLSMLAAWSIRRLPDFDQAAAWLITQMPDFDQAATWPIRRGLILIRQLPVQSGSRLIFIFSDFLQ